MLIDKWDQRFMEMAEFVSRWSKDPSTKVGAVIAKGKRLKSVGFNGLSQNIADTKERLENRELKYKTTLHAEENAYIFASKKVKGCTIYTWPFMPCVHCASLLIQVGIKRVVAPYSDNERWIEDFKLSSQLFSEAGVLLDLDGGPVGGYLV